MGPTVSHREWDAQGRSRGGLRQLGAALVAGEWVDGGGREWRKWDPGGEANRRAVVARPEVDGGGLEAARGGRPWRGKGAAALGWGRG